MTTEYQQAVLQAMSIPLYVQSLKESALEEPAVEKQAVLKQAPSPETSKAAERQLVDESDPFVRKVLSAIGFDTLQEAQLKWFIDEAPEVLYVDSVLVTPQLSQLQTPSMKKRLWLAIQHLRRESE